MASKSYTSRLDPAEGSRDVVDRELKRQAQGDEHPGAEHKAPRTAARPSHETKNDRAKTAR
jgi:hypothetical protein